jgi:hypothetical protein
MAHVNAHPQLCTIAHWYRMLEVTIIAKIQTLSIENIFYDGDIVRWRMSMRTPERNCIYHLVIV